MAHPYNTRAAFNIFHSSRDVSALLDLDQDGSEDAGLYDQLREDADLMIDARLARIYSVPFDIVPGLIGTISNHLTSALLFSRRNPDSPDSRVHMEQVDALLNGLLRKDLALPGAPVVSSDEARAGLAYSAATPIVAGRDEDDDERMANW